MTLSELGRMKAYGQVVLPNFFPIHVAISEKMRQMMESIRWYFFNAICWLTWRIADINDAVFFWADKQRIRRDKEWQE